MKKGCFLLFFCISNFIFSQNKLYINLVTHNEMLDEYYDTNESEYNSAKQVCNQILNQVTSINAKWNFQTCSKFVLAALNWENAHVNSNDILEKMFLSGRVEIDSRNKTLPLEGYNYNISDVYHLLDSCGVTSTKTVGGFLYYPYNNQDWTQFRNPKIGAVYGLPWQAEIIWGGGSPGHINDNNDYGVWKPKDGTSESEFYTHDESKNLWLIGNGCVPVIYDTTTNVQWIVNLIRNNIKNIKNGIWPNNKFYSLSVMTNVKHFDSPGYFQKVKTVLDSISVFVNNGDAIWASITEKMSHFNTWKAENMLNYSQWSCDEASQTNYLNENSKEMFSVYPNPSDDILFINNLHTQNNVAYYLCDSYGRILTKGVLNSNENQYISLKNYSSGYYLLKINNQTINVIKK